MNFINKFFNKKYFLTIHKTIASILLFCCVMAMPLLLDSCKNETPTKNETKIESVDSKIQITDAQYKNAKISITKIIEKEIASTLNLNGKIDVPPQNLVSVSVPLGGYLKNTKLLPGMHIAKGEVIAIVEDQQYIQIQQDYLLTKSKLYFAEKEYQRQRELNINQASSDKVTQQAESEVRNNKILLSALTEKLKLVNINPQNLTENNLSKSINIYAPIEGYVSKVNVNIGKYITSTDVLFELVNPSDIHLNLKVYEKDINNLQIGQKLQAYTNSQMDKKYDCEIILISKDVSSDGASEVHCHFKNYDKNLLPGMYMNAIVELNNAKTTVLPESSVVNFENKNYVFVQNDNTNYEMIEVSLGQKEAGFIQVNNASAIIDKNIVDNGSYALLMTMKNKAEEE